MAIEVLRRGIDGGCPICGEHDASCTISTRGVLCKNGADPVPEGWGYAGVAPSGTWKMYYKKDGNLSGYSSKGFRPKATKKEKKEETVKSALSFDQRHRVYQSVLDKAFISDELKLYDKVRATLPFAEKYGITQFSKEMTQELADAGLCAKGQTYYFDEFAMRLWIPIRGITGTIEGFQGRRTEIKEFTEKGLPRNPKYQWLSGKKEGNSIHNYFGEVPLQIVHGAVDTVIFTEGCLKPIHVFEKLEGRASVVGAIGGHWTSSPMTLEVALSYFLARGTKNFVIAPDAGWKINEGVKLNIVKLRRFAAKMGIDINIANLPYGDQKVDGHDPDEVPTELLMKAIGLETNKGLTRDIEAIHEHLSKGGLSYNGTLAEKADFSLDDEPNKVLELLDTHDNILNMSPVGFGKSHAVEQIHQSRKFKRVIYVSQSNRNLPTAYIEANAYCPPVRHNGLVDTGNLTPLKRPILRRPKAGESTDTLGSCHKTNEHLKAMELGVAGTNICNSCPFHTSCREGSSEDGSNNYLYTKALRGNVDTSLIATSFQGLSDWMFELDDTLLIIDEPTQILPSYEKVSIPASVINYLSTSLPGTWSQTDGRWFYEPVDEKEEYEGLLQEDAIAYEKLNSWFACGQKGVQPAKPQLTTAFELLVSEGLLKSGGVFTATKIHARTQHFLGLATKVLWLDATCVPSVLKATYAIDSLVSVGAEDKATNNLTFEAMICDGLNTSKWMETETGKAIAKEIRSRLGVNDAVATHCAAREGDDIGYHSDSRGSNRIKHKGQLHMISLPHVNRGELERIYSCMVNPTFTFEEYAAFRTEAEIIQTAGRLRAIRRQGVDLVVKIYAHARFDFLEKRGFKVKYRVAAFEGIESAHTRQTRFIYDLVQKLKQGFKGTQKQLSEELGVASSSVSRSLKRVGLSLRKLKDLIVTTAKRQVKWAEPPAQIVNQINKGNLTEEVMDFVGAHIECIGAKGVKMSQWKNAIMETCMRSAETLHQSLLISMAHYQRRHFAFNE